jgi:predicted nucleic acid-binding protein
MIDLPYIFVDTSAWYALLDKSDANHHAAVNFKDSLDHPMVTSNYSDKTFSFTDCTSFSLMERVEITEVFAFDDHFMQYGVFSVLPLQKI